jgi:glycosyltransferase involved in cell wall biosynthesis
MKKKKILIHSIAFSPDGVSTAYLYNDLALAFKDEGFEVVVLSTTPHYNRVASEIAKQPLKPKFWGLWKESDFHGISVIHVPQKKFKSSLLRVAGFVYWHIVSLILGIAEKNVSLIISPSPPLTIGLINIIIAKIKKAKVVYNVQEIYPDFLLNQGKLKFKPALRILEALEKYVYNHSDAVTTIDSVFYHTIVARFKDKSKLKLIPNFVDMSVYKPYKVNDNFYNEIFPKKPEVLKIMYAGNIGHAQDWEPLFFLAKAFKNKQVEFWIIGEGVMKGHVEDQIKIQEFNNVHVVPYQERNKMPSLIAYADLHFIFMSPKMDGQGFPSKVYTIMACAKPLLVVSSKNTPIYDFLKPLTCSFLISDNNLNDKCLSLENSINSILIDKTILSKLGSAGVGYIQNSYSKEIVTSKYVDLIKELLVC